MTDPARASIVPSIRLRPPEYKRRSYAQHPLIIFDSAAATRSSRAVSEYLEDTFLPLSGLTLSTRSIPLEEPQRGSRRRVVSGSGLRYRPASLHSFQVPSFPFTRMDERIAELREAASDEDVTLSDASEQALRMFVDDGRVSVLPMLTLRTDGNLRALWESNNGEQIGIQFLDRELVNYVLFSKLRGGEIGRHFGVADHEFVRGLIDLCELGYLI